MIEQARGNLLEAEVEALVNTVNTVGAMGKGIALQFKRAFPEMFRDYSQAVARGEVEIGRMHVWCNTLAPPRFIINFPTKQHWRQPSRLEYIEKGLNDLVRVIQEQGIRSIAVPPLGCGLGGLSWQQVEPLIHAHLAQVDALVVVYPPEGAPLAGQMIERRTRPRLTLSRALLVSLMADYAKACVLEPSVMEAQKLMYFSQEAGVPLNLRFCKGFYGPYSDQLRHLFISLEGHYLQGFGDGSTRVNQAEPLRLLTDASEEARVFLHSHREVRSAVRRVLQLAEGYEDAYGMELLASTHWAGRHGVAGTPSVEDAISTIHAWTKRKERIFTADHIRHAWDTLVEKGWLTV